MRWKQCSLSNNVELTSTLVAFILIFIHWLWMYDCALFCSVGDASREVFVCIFVIFANVNGWFFLFWFRNVFCDSSFCNSVIILECNFVIVMELSANQFESKIFCSTSGSLWFRWWYLSAIEIVAVKNWRTRFFQNQCMYHDKSARAATILFLTSLLLVKSSKMFLWAD